MADRTRKPTKSPVKIPLKKTETSVVKQSFSHGRTKNVVVEKKRRNPEDAYGEAARIINLARQVGASELDLKIQGLKRIPSLHNMKSVQSVDLEGTLVADISPLRTLVSLQALNLSRTPVSNLEPISRLQDLQLLVLQNSTVSDLTPLADLRNLEILDMSHTRVVRLAPLATLTRLHTLSIAHTNVFDLAPLSRMTALVDGATSDSSSGLHFLQCPSLNQELRNIAELPNPKRTLEAINYIRSQQGIPPYRPLGELDSEPLDAVQNLLPLEGVPSPFAFEQTKGGTITVADSDTNFPAFPFATSREDHAQRLEACKTYADDLIAALDEHKYHNIRGEFLTSLRRYAERLPKSAATGNMLLADGMARTLSKLFASEAEILPTGFSSELHTLLEQHIATCVYYPEIGAFNRDVRDGNPSRPFPIHAAEAFAKVVQDHTPKVFDSSVGQVLSEASSIPPPIEASPGIPAPSPKTLTPPQIPGGETSPKKSREFSAAATANRLWKTVHVAASVTTVASGIGLAAHQLAPFATELIQWLSEVINSLTIVP